MNTSDLTHLNGESVLVRSRSDHRDPPIALRGTLEVRTDADGSTRVNILLEYPDMNNRAWRRGVIPLNDADLDRLVAGKREGPFEYTIDDPLEPPAEV